MQIGIIGHYEARALNCQRLGSEGEKSRSHETEYILRGLALRSSSFSICEFMLYSCIDEYTRWSPPQKYRSEALDCLFAGWFKVKTTAPAASLQLSIGNHFALPYIVILLILRIFPIASDDAEVCVAGSLPAGWLLLVLLLTGLSRWSISEENWSSLMHVKRALIGSQSLLQQLNSYLLLTVTSVTSLL